MTLNFRETTEGLVPCQEATGNLVVLDPSGRDSFVNGACAGVLTGWDKGIGYQPEETTKNLGPYKFFWLAPYWTLIGQA